MSRTLVRRPPPVAEAEPPKRKPLVRARTTDPAPATPAGEREKLHVKWRPKTLADVWGQEHVTTNLQALFESGRVPHTFLFTGPSGTGKTTFARICAAMTECSDVIEHDAARFNSIQAVRALVESAQYASLGENPRKFIIIDECQRISSAAFDVLLKSTEEPAAHLFWAFCTTEPDKIPKTLHTRAHAYGLKPLPWDMLADYCEQIAKAEQINVPKEFIEIAARRADGSPRQALVYLSMLEGITERAHALQIVEDYEAQEAGPVELARMLVSDKGASWARASELLRKLSEEHSPETIRLTVLNYTTAVLLKEQGEKQAGKLLAIVQAFSVPCSAGERMAPLLLAVGGLLLGG